MTSHTQLSLTKRKRILKRILRLTLILFVLLNVIAFFHAYSFTHFSNSAGERSSQSPNFAQKLKILFSGIDNPRPKNQSLPQIPYENITVQSNKKLQCWLIRTDNAKGTIILFHGYGGEKSSMLDKANCFLELGFNTMLVDFMGAGSSEGNITTIGYEEATEVKDCYIYLQNTGHKNIVLFGTSMGAVAIMKAISDYGIHPSSIILECPFGTMYKTVCARFKMLHVPSFPMAGLLVFWGGVQNGFWAFSHNPQEYAKKINCRTLLLYGEKDVKVSRDEIDEIHSNLKGFKQLKTYPLAGHENYLTKYQDEWRYDVDAFLNNRNE